MFNYLLTGARSPAALELARNLGRHGHQVYAADSLVFPITRFSRSISDYSCVASPRHNPDLFITQLINIVKDRKIDFLIPTCEEVFYISSHKEILTNYCTVFCPDFSLIEELHSKYRALEFADNSLVKRPETRLLTRDELSSCSEFDNQIVKPEYGRFGTNVLLNPSHQSVIEMTLRQPGNYLLQEKISGDDVCSYSLAHKGKLQLHIAYKPSHRAGKSAGIYFDPVAIPKLTEFVRNFVEQTNYSGQIGFDFILREQELFLIECNPRATSGIHLFHDTDIGSSVIGENMSIDPSSNPAMIGLAIALYSPISGLTNRKWLKRVYRDCRRAREVIYASNDKKPAFMQLLSLAELTARSIRLGLAPRKVTTSDIEWNGKEIV